MVGQLGVGTAATGPENLLDPNWAAAGFSHQTIRQTIRLSSGGRLVRIRLSNRYGTKPLHVTGAGRQGYQESAPGSGPEAGQHAVQDDAELSPGL